MRVALIDLKESPRGCNNKDKSGSFGNTMSGEGLFSKLYGFLKSTKARTPVVHMGYLSAIFRKSGHSVHYYESFPKDEDLVILASSITGYDEELEFARKVKEKNPRAKVGFINAFSTVKPEIFLDGGADFILPGEPEWAAIELAEGRLEPKGVLPQKLMEDLEALPFPDWRGFPVARFDYWPALKRRPVLPVVTSRGCSFDCSFCPYMVTQTKKFRSVGAKYAVDEIQFHQKHHGIRSVVFRDIIFSIHKPRTAELAEEILRRRVKIEFTCETRTDCLTEELLELLARAGLRTIHFGIESPEDAIVKQNGRKPIAETQQEKIIRACERLGIKVIAFYILGFLQDTPETMQHTINYARHLNTYLAQFNLMTPYPGTRYYEELKDRILTEDWKQYTSYHPLIRLDHIDSGTLLQYKQKAYRDYYFNWKWFAKNGLQVAWG